jgi:tellurium resistance protein TerZ
MISLAPLDRFDLSQLAHSPNRLKIGLGWQPDEQPQGLLQRLLGQDSPVDLDAACLVMDKTNNLIDLVWYKNLRTRDDSIQHLGDSMTGDDRGDLADQNGLVDQESMLVLLDKLAASVETLLFCVCSHGGHDFSSIKQAHFRMMDARSGDELVRFDLSQHGKNTGLILARLTRNADRGWSLQALGEPVDAQTPDQVIELAHQWL